jgi:hypothetical protein
MGILNKIKVPKANESLGSESDFGVGNILGLIFLLIGILLILALTDFNLPINLGGIEIILSYGAALGSILGGLSMLFKKK